MVRVVASNMDLVGDDLGCLILKLALKMAEEKLDASGTQRAFVRSTPIIAG
jgi:hypothetical protein